MRSKSGAYEVKSTSCSVRAAWGANINIKHGSGGWIMTWRLDYRSIEVAVGL